MYLAIEAWDNKVGHSEYFQYNICALLTIMIKASPDKSFPDDPNKPCYHKLDRWELNQQNYRR